MPPPGALALLLAALVAGACALDARMFVPGAVVANAGSCADPCPGICAVQCAAPCVAALSLACRECTTECHSICLNQCDETVRAQLSLLPAASADYTVRIGHATSTSSYAKAALLNATLLGGGADVLLLTPTITCMQTIAYALVNVSGSRASTTAQLLWLYKSASCAQILGTTTLAALTPVRRGARITVGSAVSQNLPWGRCSSIASWPCLTTADCPPGTLQCVGQPSVLDASIDGVGDTVTVEAIPVIPPPEPNDGPPVLPARCGNSCSTLCVNGTCAAVCADSGAASADCLTCIDNCYASCFNGCDECEADRTIVTLVQSAGTPPADPCASFAICQFAWSWRAGYISDDPAAPVLYLAEWFISWPQTGTVVNMGPANVFCTSGGIQNAIKVVLITTDYLNSINYTYATGGANLDCPTIMRNFSSPFTVPGFNPVTRVAMSINVRIASGTGFRRYVNEPSSGLCESPADQWCISNQDCAGGGNSCQRYPIYLDKVYECNTSSITLTPQPTRSPSRTPSSTATPTPTTTPTPSVTPTPSQTSTGTRTPTSSNTPTPSQTPSNSPTATGTQTPSLTETSTPSQTPSETPTQTPTQTPTGTQTSSQTPTPSQTATQTPSETATASPTGTPTPSQTASPSETATLTPTQTASATAPVTPTATPTRTPSQTPSTNATPSQTPPVTPSLTAAPTASPSITPSQTPPSTPSTTETPTGTPSETPTQSATGTASGTASSSATATVSTSLSPSGTATQTSSRTSSASPSRTASITASASVSPSRTASITASVSASLSHTASATASVSVSLSRSASATASASASQSRTPSTTASVSPSASPVKKHKPSPWWIPLVVVLGVVALLVLFAVLSSAGTLAGPLIAWENTGVRAPRVRPASFSDLEL